MEVRLQKLGKKFTRHWIFRNLDDTIQSGEKIAIVGPNGSGKSTLLQIISGAQPYTEGKIEYHLNGFKIDSDAVFQYLSFAAPYSQNIEELNLRELFKFHSGFKKMTVSFTSFLELLQYPFKPDQLIRYYSSGMKQRIKLALALLAENELVLLDEPTSNLDQSGKDWYQEIISKNMDNRTLIIASNEPFEYQITERQIVISQVDFSTS